MALTRCLDCGTRTQGSRCATCTHLHAHAHGRNTHRWQKLRAARKQLDSHQCTYCGSTQDLTVHLHPYLVGNHRAATLTDCVTACRSCNSRLGDRFFYEPTRLHPASRGAKTL